MADLEAEKALAAERAVAEIKPYMRVGLGTGSTSAYAVRALARRMKEGLTVEVTCTSMATERLATSLGIATTPFNGLSRLDLTIDGADEIDPSLRAIKGGGGALLREKVIASASDRVIIIVDSSKPVAQLGRFKLPVEVLPFAAQFAMCALDRLGAAPELRTLGDGTPFMTDQGANIIDLAWGTIPDPTATALSIDDIPGVLEHGLFLTEIDEVIIGRGAGTEIQRRSKRNP